MAKKRTFNAETLINRIAVLRKDHKLDDVVTMLNKEKFTNSTGGKITRGWVYANAPVQRTAYKKKATTTSSSSGAIDIDLARKVLNSDGYSPEQRISLLRGVLA